MDLGGRRYKVRLQTGRVLGPLDLGRIRKLILKNQIIGNEQAREDPLGEWMDINLHPEISELLLARIEGRLTKDSDPPRSVSGYQPLMGHVDPRVQMAPTVVLVPESPPPLPTPQESTFLASPTIALATQFETAVLPTAGTVQPPPREVEIEIFGHDSLITGLELRPDNPRSTRKSEEAFDHLPPPPLKSDLDDDPQGEERTRLAPASESGLEPEKTSVSQEGDDPERTEFQKVEGTATRLVMSNKEKALEFLEENRHPAPVQKLAPIDYGLARNLPGFEMPAGRDVANEKTVVFQRSRFSPNITRISGSPGGKKQKNTARNILVAVLAMFAAHEALFGDGDTAKNQAVRAEPIRPRLPRIVSDIPSDPVKSQETFKVGMKFYEVDTVVGYKKAADQFLLSATQDINNVKSLAMLASSYLNLIDSSNKDENYFAVISKLIEMSRAKSLDLPETVISDVEFYITANRAEAAKQRIVEYTKNNKNFEPVMFYYIASVFAARGDYPSANRYIMLYPEKLYKSPRIYHFRGLMAEKYGDDDAALKEYLKAIQLYPNHAKSMLKIAELYNRHARLKDASQQLKFLSEHPYLLPPKDLARAYYLIALSQELVQKWDHALGYMERAVRLVGQPRLLVRALYSASPSGGRREGCQERSSDVRAHESGRKALGGRNAAGSAGQVSRGPAGQHRLTPAADQDWRHVHAAQRSGQCADELPVGGRESS